MSIRDRQIDRELSHNIAARRDALEDSNRAAQGLAATLTKRLYKDIKEELALISELLYRHEYAEAAKVWGSCLGGIKFRSTKALDPLWYFLSHERYAPNSSTLDDIVSTALHALITTVISTKPPTLTRCISTLSRDMSHAASMAFIYRYQSLSAVKAIKERAKTRKLSIPLSVRESLERKTAIEMFQSQVKAQLERHRNPNDPFKLEGPWVNVMTEYGGMRRISLKKNQLPEEMDWKLLDLCFGTGREWDTIAMIVIGLFLKHTGMIELKRKHTKGKKRFKKAVHVCLTEESTLYFEKGIKGWIDTVHRQEPMIFPPENGGYLTHVASGVTYKKSCPLGENDRAIVTRATDTIQWEEVVAGMANTAYASPSEIIPKLRKKNLTLFTEGESTNEEFIRNQSILAVASRSCESWKTTKLPIYFPIVMDFRGRTYYRTTIWNPQGTDLSKALLRSVTRLHSFVPQPSYSCPHEENKLKYIAYRGLVGGGWDKRPLPESINWKDIQNYVATHRAEEKYQEALFDRTDPHQLYQLDGTCNGLQHLSAMMRDRAAGKSVNLCDHPGETVEGPADIYREVAALVLEKLKRIEEPWAKRLLRAGLRIDRGFTKRQVMIIPYGATEPTIKTLTVKNLMEQAANLDSRIWTHSSDPDALAGNYHAFKDRELERHPLFKNDGNKLGSLLAKTIKKDVLAGAFELMQVLKDFAKTSKGRAVSWRVRNDERSLWVVSSPIKRYNNHNRTIGIHLPGMAQRLLQYGLRTDEDGLLKDHNKIDMMQVTKGIVPNFVHSHDADHMARVCGAMSRHGHPITAIHDCFATTSSGLVDMARIIREAFVEKYTHGPEHPFSQPVRFIRSVDTPKHLKNMEWDSWYDAVEEMVGPEAREILERDRGLNIKDVIDSPFFFC